MDDPREIFAADITEPGWIPFNAAANEIKQLFGGSLADAQKRLREACASERVRTMKALYDMSLARQMPFEFWCRVAPNDWRERQVDFDGPVSDDQDVFVMVNEDDFQQWLTKPQSVCPARTQPKRKAAEDAIQQIWRDGIPSGVVNGDIEKKVGAWLKERGLSHVGRDTILRAAGRK